LTAPTYRRIDMDKVIENIRENSQSERALKDLKIFLSKDDFYKSSPHVEEALATLDPSIHTLGYTYLLAARIGKGDVNRFQGLAQNLLLNANASQARMAPAKFQSIAQRFLDHCVEAGQPLRAVKPLYHAVTRLRPNTNTLTPLHSHFLHACILSKSYHMGFNLIEQEIFEVTSGETSGVSIKDVLSYFYFAGLIYIGLKLYKKALASLRVVIVAPANTLSAIMIEAYKKYALVSLIIHGKVAASPRYASVAMTRGAKSITAYQDFITTFGKHNSEELHKVATTHTETFIKDKNFGLVKQAIQAQYKQSIQRSTQTYLTLSLEELTQSVNLSSAKDTEKHILKMIENKEIYATINVKDGMISFGDASEEYDTNDAASSLDGRIQRVISYARRIRHLDDTISSSQQYISKTVSREGKWGGAGSEMDDEGFDGKGANWGNKMN